MLRASDRTFSRRDTVSVLVCLGLSLLGLFLPSSVGLAIASNLRDSAFTPLIWLQARAEDGRTSKARFRAVVAQRDSAAFAAQFVPAISAENRQLRGLLGLRNRLTTPYVAAEVLHQSTPTDGRMLLVHVGGRVDTFEPVIAASGLIGVVWSGGDAQATVMTWAHPEFRVSASSPDGRVFGMVAPSAGGSASETSLEFRSTSYRDTLPVGTPIISSGLGGVYPRGIPLGTVLGIAREQAGWERVYRMRPAANPSSVSDVMILRAPRAASVQSAYPGDSLLAALRADTLRRLRLADSLLRVHIVDSLLKVLQHDSTRRVPRDSVGPSVRLSRPDTARARPRVDSAR